MIGSSPLGSRVLGDNAAPAANAVSNGLISNSISAADAVEQLFVFDDIAQLSISAVEEIELGLASASSIVTISESTISEDVIGGVIVTDVGLYQYEFQAFELQIAATDSVTFRPALREFFTDTTSTVISATATLQQKFVFVDQLNINVGDFEISYEFEGLVLELQDDYPGLPIAPISINSIGEIQYEGPQNFQPGLIELSIGASDDTIKSVSRTTSGSITIDASDNDDGRAAYVRPEDGKEEWPWFRPSLEFEQVDTVVLSLVNLTGDSTAYLFASDGIDRLENYPGLPISPISVNAIGTIQYEGTMDYQPSIGQLDLVANSIDNLIAVYDDTTSLRLSIDWNDGEGIIRASDGKTEYPYFRPSLEVDRDYVTFKSLSAVSQEYLFEFNVDYQTLTGAGIPIGPISFSSISEEQQIAGSLANFFNYTDVVPLVIGATGELDTNRQEYEFEDVIPISVNSLGIVYALYPRADNVSLAVGATDKIGKKFVYVDSAVFSVGQPSAVVSISANKDVTPLVIRGTTQTSQAFIKIESTGVSVVASSSTSIVVQQPAVVIANTVSAISEVDVIYKPRQNVTPVKTFAVDNAYRVTSGAAYDYILELDNVSNLALSKIVDSFNSVANQTGYDINDNEVYLTFYKQGVIQHAIRHLSVSQTNLGSRSFYNYNKPRAQASTINNVKKIVLDTNPRMLSWATATFDNVTYNLTSTGFEFDEIRYYQGDPANNDQRLLWTASVGTDLQILATANAVKTTLVPEQFVPLEIDLIDDYFASYKVPDEDIELDIAASFVQTNRYRYRDFGSFIKGGASGIVTTLGSIDTTPLVIGDNDSFEILYNFAIDNLSLEIGETHLNNIIRNYVDLSALEINGVDAFNRTYDRAVGNAELQIGETHLNSIIRNYTDTNGFVIGETHLNSIIRNYADSVDFVKIGVESIEITSDVDTILFSTLTATDEMQVSYVYDDTADFIKLTTESTEFSVNYDTVLINTFAVTDIIEQTLVSDNTGELGIAAEFATTTLFVFDDTAEFVQLGADSIIVISDYDNVAFNSFGASDSIEIILSYSNIGELSVTASSPEIISESSVAELEISIDFSTLQIFVVDDTAQFVQLGATSVEIIFDKDTVASLEIAVVDVLSQSYNFVDSTAFRTFVAFDDDIIRNIVSNAALEIGDNDLTTIAYNYSKFIVALESSANSTQENIFAFNDVELLEIDANVAFSRSYNYVDSATFVQLAAADTSFTANRDTIVELEIAVNAAQSTIFNYVDSVNVGVVTISDQQIIYDFADVEFVEFSVSSVGSNTLNSIETSLLALDSVIAISRTYAIPAVTLELELDAFDSVSKTFAIEDTAVFGILGASDSEFIYNFEAVEFVAFAATDDIDVIYNISSIPAVDIADAGTQSSTRQFIDSVNFVQLGVASTEILVNVENEGTLQFGIFDDIDIIYNFTPEAYLERDVFDDINQSVSRKTTAIIEFGSITNQYYYTKFKQIYANDTIEFKIGGQGDGFKLSGRQQQESRQIWIG